MSENNDNLNSKRGSRERSLSPDKRQDYLSSSPKNPSSYDSHREERDGERSRDRERDRNRDRDRDRDHGYSSSHSGRHDRSRRDRDRDYEYRSSRSESNDRHGSKTDESAGVRSGGSSGGSSSGSRRRRWDSGPSAENTNPSSSSSSSIKPDPLALAAAAAAKINAQIAAKARDHQSSRIRSQSPNVSTPINPLKLNTSINNEVKPHNTSGNVRKLAEQIDINDFRNKYLLTRGETQAKILEETGAVVITRGRYYPDKSMATEQVPPLHLVIEASDEETLKRGVEKVQEIINKDMGSLVDERRFRRKDQQSEHDALDIQKQPNASQEQQKDDSSTGQAPFRPRGGQNMYDGNSNGNRPQWKRREERVVVGLEKYEPFHVRGYIVGPGGQNVKHVQNETDCRVQVRGRGSGFIDRESGREEDVPMYLHIYGNDHAKLDEAKAMCEDLIASVTEQIEERHKQQNHHHQDQDQSNGTNRNYQNYHHNNTHNNHSQNQNHGYRRNNGGNYNNDYQNHGNNQRFNSNNNQYQQSYNQSTRRDMNKQLRGNPGTNASSPMNQGYDNDRRSPNSGNGDSRYGQQLSPSKGPVPNNNTNDFNGELNSGLSLGMTGNLNNPINVNLGVNIPPSRNFNTTTPGIVAPPGVGAPGIPPPPPGVSGNSRRPPPPPPQHRPPPPPPSSSSSSR